MTRASVALSWSGIAGFKGAGLGTLAVCGGRGGCGDGGRDTDELGEGVLGEVGEPDVPGGVDSEASWTTEAGRLVATGRRDGGAGVGEGRERVTVAVGDPDAV